MPYMESRHMPGACQIEPDGPVACLSAVVAPDWLPAMVAAQREALFDAWFLRVSASAALLALTSCALAPSPPGTCPARVR